MVSRCSASTHVASSDGCLSVPYWAGPCVNWPVAWLVSRSFACWTSSCSASISCSSWTRIFGGTSFVCSSGIGGLFSHRRGFLLGSCSLSGFSWRTLWMSALCASLCYAYPDADTSLDSSWNHFTWACDDEFYYVWGLSPLFVDCTTTSAAFALQSATSWWLLWTPHLATATPCHGSRNWQDATWRPFSSTPSDCGCGCTHSVWGTL